MFTGDGNREIQFFGKAIALESQSGDSFSSILDLGGSAAHPVTGMYFTSSEDSGTVVEGITIQNAWSDGQGGAVFISGANPRLRNLRFLGNRAAEGAAIYVTATGSFEIQDGRFDAIQGQTIVQASTLIGDEFGPGNLSLASCMFTDNAGVCVWNFTPESETSILGCDFVRNVQGFEIGTWNGASNGSLLDCTFRENVLGGRFDGGDFEFAGSSGTLEARDCD